MVKRALATRERALIAFAALCAAVAAVAVLLVGGHAAVPAPPSRLAHGPITVATSLQPNFVQVGDSIEARAVITLDRGLVRPGTLRVSVGLAPLTSLRPVRRSQVTVGHFELVTLVERVVCVTESCVSSKGPVKLPLPPVTATVTKRGGGSARASTSWPKLSVIRRVPGSSVTGRPRFAADAAPPPVSYDVSPTLLATLLSIAAALAAVGAVGLVAWQAVLYLRRRPRPGDRDELARAVRLTREAARMPVAQRRRALELLARLVGRYELSAKASGLAWSRDEPDPEALEALASDVEAER